MKNDKTKPAKISKLKALLYSSAGLGAAALITTITPLMGPPKTPLWTGE